MTDTFAPYQQFLAEMESTDLLWAITDGEGWGSCESNDFAEKEVILFWSNESLAKSVCIAEWEGYRAEALRVEDFIEHWLPAMHEDGVLVGLNWNSELEGAEQEPLLLMDDLLGEED